MLQLDSWQVLARDIKILLTIKSKIPCQVHSPDLKGPSYLERSYPLSQFRITLHAQQGAEEEEAWI